MNKQQNQKIEADDIYYRVYQSFANGMVITHIDVNFFVLKENDDGEIDEACVGYMLAQRIPSDKMSINQWLYGTNYDMVSAMENESQELHQLYQDIAHSDKEITYDILLALQQSDLYYVTKVVVDEKYRNCGVDSIMIKELPNIMSLISRSKYPLICVRPMPVELERNTEEWKKACKKLIHQYERAGFDSVNDDTTIMCYLRG